MDKNEQDILIKLPDIIEANTQKQLEEYRKKTEKMHNDLLMEIKKMNNELINKYEVILEKRIEEMAEEIIKYYNKNFETINNRLDEMMKEIQNNNKILKIENLTDELILIGKNDGENLFSNKSIRDIKKEIKELIFR